MKKREDIMEEEIIVKAFAYSALFFCICAFSFILTG